MLCLIVGRASSTPNQEPMHQFRRQECCGGSGDSTIEDPVSTLHYSSPGQSAPLIRCGVEIASEVAFRCGDSIVITIAPFALSTA